MISAEIECTYCGLKGKIVGNGQESVAGHKKIFKHLGHNPFSGHLHYQCPACSVVLLVPPVDVLEGKFLQGVTSPPGNGVSVMMHLSNFFYKLTRGMRVLQHTTILR